jgi:hypothetical protein
MDGRASSLVPSVYTLTGAITNAIMISSLKCTTQLYPLPAHIYSRAGRFGSFLGTISFFSGTILFCLAEASVGAGLSGYPTPLVHSPRRSLIPCTRACRILTKDARSRLTLRTKMIESWWR